MEHADRTGSPGESAATLGETSHRGRFGANTSEAPPGWSYNPSSWLQRGPIITIAFINFLIAAYLAVCQIGRIPAWDPFFGSGTTRVLHSNVSRFFPISDAALGAGAYLLEAICGLLGDTRRWRTKPWLVLSFGCVVVPLSIVTIILLIMQPVAVGTWCTLCLVAAAGMLLMVPLALDEVVAVFQFLIWSFKQGRPLWETFWHGGEVEYGASQSDQRGSREQAAPTPFLGISAPWNLLVCAALGIWLLIAPSVLHTFGEAAESSYVTGAVTLTLSMLALAEVARPIRFLIVFGGIWLLVYGPWTLLYATTVSRLLDVAVGTALICCCYPRGRLQQKYNGWDRYIV